MAFRFIQITDHHILESEAALNRGFSPAHALRHTLWSIGRNQPDIDFIVSTGDLVQSGTDAEYAVLRSLFGLRDFSAAGEPQLGVIGDGRMVPMYFVPGNHDPRPSFFRNMYPPTGGGGALSAMNVCFEWKGIRFVCIDWGEANKGITTPDMLDHVERSLRDGMPAIILSHHNVTPVGTPFLDGLVALDVGEFEQRVRGRNVLAVLSGHAHTTFESRIADIPVYGLRSTTYSLVEHGEEILFALRPPHYRVVTVGDDGFRSEIVEVAI